MSDPNDSTSTDDRDTLSSTFLEFCVKVRKDDPSILPNLGLPFNIRRLSEKEEMELADALLENTNVTYLEFGTYKHTKSSAEAMAKYVRTSKRLQHIRWKPTGLIDGRALKQREEMLCCFLPALQESTSLKELHMELPRIGGPSNLAFENMLTHTQSLRSLSLNCPDGLLEDWAVAAARSGLKKNTTLRELTLEFSRGTKTVSPILTSLRNHPLLRRLCMRGYGVDLTGLETLLLSDNSKITELEIHSSYRGLPIVGLTRVSQALRRRPTLTKLGLQGCRLGRYDAIELRMVLFNTPCLHSLLLGDCTLGSAGLAELAPALYRNMSIKVLDISQDNLNDMESAEILRDILCSNTTMTAIDLSGNNFSAGGVVACIAEGLGNNSTLLKIDLSRCHLGDEGVSILAQTLGSRSTTLQKLALKKYNSITSTGVGVLLEMMEQSSHHITDLDLQYNPIWNEGATLLARSLGNNALPNLTRLSLSYCGIADDGLRKLISALEQNTSLLHLVLHDNRGFSERTFSALAESLPEIKALQRVDFDWCSGLASAMPLLLAGLRKNTSLFRFHVAGCASTSVPPTTQEMARCTGGWMQEMERLGYRNRFLSLIRAPKERLPPHGVWPRALAGVATLPDVIFEVLRSKPSLVPTEDTGVPKKRKRGDE
jgi:Ran GTPase-activating protein (RanGAP) involved in mRNA processing and transport